MNTELEAALAYDGLAEAERITGKSYKEDDLVTMLGMTLMQKQRKLKDELLSLNRDTCFSNTLTQQIEAIEGMGFNLVLCEDIPGTSDKWRIFWRPGVLLFCDSYFDDTSLNSGNAYLNYKGPREAIKHASNGHCGEIDGVPVWSCSFDIREGLRHRLDSLSESGEILETWLEQPFMWLLHYKDTKAVGYNYEEINAKRISMLPNEIQSAIS